MALHLKLPVQVPFVLLVLGISFSGTITLNWLMYRTCDISLHVNKSDCLKLLYKHTDNFTDELERKVQPYVTNITMTRDLLTAIFSAAMCLFLGSWSDTYGRKPVLLLGSGAYALGTIIQTIISSIPNISPWYILLCGIPTCFSGGITVYFAVNVCYITDITTPQNRGFRIMMFYLYLSGAYIIGQLSSSFALEKVDFMLLYVFSSICVLLSFLLTYFFLEESLLNPEREGKFANLFKISNVTDTIKVTFKKRENMDRTLILIIVAILTLCFLLISVDSLQYYYLRTKFFWTLQQFTVYNSMNMVIAIFANGVLIYVLNKLLKTNESIIVLIGTVALTVSSILFGLSSSNWHIYTAGIINCFGTAVSPMLRSLVSKIVTSDDYGKIFSFIAISESIIGPLGSPLFTFVYNKTLDVYPGAYYLVAGGFNLVMCILSVIIVVIQVRYNQMSYSNLIPEVPDA